MFEKCATQFKKKKEFVWCYDVILTGNSYYLLEYDRSKTCVVSGPSHS
jgi:hypothetical protein